MYRKLILFLVISGLMLFASSVFAMQWQLADDGDPAPRAKHVMAYDSLKSKVLLFGGETGILANVTDTWEYQRSSWARKRPETYPRFEWNWDYSGMFYDESRDRFVLILIDRNDDEIETWEYDRDNWTKIETLDTPPYSSSIGTAYDKWRNRVVLYDGSSNSTWEYDGSNWSEVSTASTPGDRTRFKMVYDSLTRRVLLFGGWIDGFANDLWQYDGTDWSPVAAVNPPPARGGFGLAYNDRTNRVVLHGGFMEGRIYLTDTWEFDGSEWREIATPNSPPARRSHHIVFDSKRNKIVLFGGYVALEKPGECDFRNIYYDDTWEFDGMDWGEIKTKDAPSARRYAGSTYDSDNKIVWMFGGKNVDEGCPLNDTWLYDGKWQEVNPTNPSPPVKEPRLVYDSNRKRLVLLGRWYNDPPFCCQEEQSATWEFDGTNWYLVNTSNTLPDSEYIEGICFDSVRNRVIVVSRGSFPDYTLETWEYDGTDWSQITTPHIPTSRLFFSIAFDKLRGKTVLYGGEDRTTQDGLRDTWEYDGTDWVEISIPNSPEAAIGTEMTFDSFRGVVVLYGGDLPPPYDTWAYDGNDWQQIQTTGSPTVPSQSQLVFDEKRKRTILFGGLDLVSGLSGGTWELKGGKKFK